MSRFGLWANDEVTVPNRYGRRAGLRITQPSGVFAVTNAGDAVGRRLVVGGTGDACARHIYWVSGRSPPITAWLTAPPGTNRIVRLRHGGPEHQPRPGPVPARGQVELGQGDVAPEPEHVQVQDVIPDHPAGGRRCRAWNCR